MGDAEEKRREEEEEEGESGGGKVIRSNWGSEIGEKECWYGDPLSIHLYTTKI